MIRNIVANEPHKINPFLILQVRKNKKIDPDSKANGLSSFTIGCSARLSRKKT
jgi:hypothetical protein